MGPDIPENEVNRDSQENLEETLPKVRFGTMSAALIPELSQRRGNIIRIPSLGIEIQIDPNTPTEDSAQDLGNVGS